MQQGFDSAAILSFLQQQFPALQPGEKIEIRAFYSQGGNRGLRDFFNSPQEATDWIVAKVPTTMEVYYGVNPRLGRDGTKEGVASIRTLWCDMDFKHFDSPEDAEALLDGFDLAPTTIIRSGGGLQVYWSLKAGLDNGAGRRIEHVLRRLYLRLGNLDAVQDLSRILRIPGTFNNKKEYGQPRPVRQVFHDLSAVYTLEDFERCLPILPIREHNQPLRLVRPGEGEKPTPEEMRTMLSFIPPTLPYSDYLSVWMGVASVYPDQEGFEIVDEWSSQPRQDNGQYSSPRTQPQKHSQFRRSGYGMGTVVHYAKLGGWIPPETPRPRMIRRIRSQEWRSELEGIRDPPTDELPELFQKGYDYLGGLTEPFPRDWTTGMIASFASILFPQMKFENLGLNLWFLGVAGQGAGKNAMSDALYDALRGVRGADYGTYTSGTSEGMFAALEGEGKSLLCYHREYGDHLAGMKREYMSGIKGVLCDLYDGRGTTRRLSRSTVTVERPHVAMIATTTQTNIRENMLIADLQTGYISRFLCCAPDVWNVDSGNRPTEADTAAFAEYLNKKVRELSGVRYVMWDAGLGHTPEPYIAYRTELGVGTGEIRRFEDEINKAEVPQGRLLARVKKLAAVFEASERQPQIRGNVLYVRESNLSLAIVLVRRFAAQAKALYNLVTSSEDENLMLSIESELRKHKTLTQRELLRKTRCNVKQLRPVVDFLKEDDFLVEDSDSRRRVVYSLKGMA